MSASFFTPELVLGWLLRLVFIAPAVLLAVTVHEFAHGASANLLGDPTAKRHGRVSLNPLRHLEPLGSLMFVFFGFGWGKPVPVDSANFRRPRVDTALVSLAGPASNFVTAALIGLIIKARVFTGFAGNLVEMTALINIYLGVFNLFPLPPLDGSRLVAALLPARLLERYQALEGYGVAIIFVAIYFRPGTLTVIFDPFVGFFKQLLLA